MAAKSAYDRNKARARQRSSAQSRAGRDIGDIPPVKDSAAKQRACVDFRFFCETYFPRKFFLAWSPDHLRVIAKIEQAVLQGGLFAVAMPRGSGKTTLSLAAVLWALLTGAHRFVYLVGASEDHALTLLDGLRADLAGNDALAGGFPEVCHPIRCLEGETRRCVGQLHHGQPTQIGFGADEIILPTIPGSRAAGAVVRVAGITGNIRGAFHTTATGAAIRPTLVIADDLQTDQSARSPSQCGQRLATINGAILNLAGPGQKIAAVMPCTVIRAGDVADVLLDRDKNPEWQGERCKMVYNFPTNEKLWTEYARIRGEGFATGGRGAEATDFYRQHQEDMDAGAVIAWPERHNPDELSAVQHAMNLRFRDEASFFAEYQNEPHPQTTDAAILTADEIMQHTNGMARGIAPQTAELVTAFVDVHQELLFFGVAAWSTAFDGAIIEYGTYPDQRRARFELRTAAPKLSDTVSPAVGREGAIYAGLEALVGILAGREWKREDGTPLRLSRCLIDAGYEWPLVTTFTRRSPHAAILLPSRGVGIGASGKPISDYSRTQGDRIGFNWYLPRPKDARAIRHIRFDSNFWKSFLHARLAIPTGGRGALTLWGHRPAEHELFAEHLCAEYPTRTFGQGRAVDEWKQRPSRDDNHWLDCAVGCAVAASLAGASPLATIAGATAPTTRAAPRRRGSVTYME